jgi:hypothetical protein
VESDLLLAIREVDEVIHLQEEMVVWKWWGLMPCDLLSNPMVAEYTLARLGFNAFRLRR